MFLLWNIELCICVCECVSVCLCCIIILLLSPCKNVETSLTSALSSFIQLISVFPIHHTNIHIIIIYFKIYYVETFIYDNRVPVCVYNMVMERWSHSVCLFDVSKRGCRGRRRPLDLFRTSSGGVVERRSRTKGPVGKNIAQKRI